MRRWFQNASMPRTSIEQPQVSEESAAPTVLHVIWRLSDTGGVAIVVRNIIRHYSGSASDLHIATARSGPEDRLDALGDRCTIHVLSSTFGRGSGVIDRVKLMWSIMKLIRRLQPAVVHTHSGTAWWTLMARFASPRRSWLLEVHDAPGNGRHGQVTERLEGWLCRRAGYLALCHSTSVRAEVRARWHLDAAQTRVFPLGIDTGEFSRVTDVSAWRRKSAPTPVPSSSWASAVLVPSKRFEQWLDVASTLARARPDDFRFVVVGNGPEQGKPRRTCSCWWAGPPCDLHRRAVPLRSGRRDESFGCVSLDVRLRRFRSHCRRGDGGRTPNGHLRRRWPSRSCSPRKNRMALQAPDDYPTGSSGLPNTPTYAGRWAGLHD